MLMTRTGYSGKVEEVMRYLKITSTANQHIKNAIQIREKRATYKHSAFLIEGPHLVATALEADIKIREVFAADVFLNKKENRGLLQGLSRRAGQVFEVTDQVLRKITETETPQGVVAVVSYTPPGLHELSFRADPFLVVIDGIQDPGNLGTIIRTADAAGTDAVILLPGTCDAFMPKAVRATAGSIFHLPVVYAEPEALTPWLRENNIRLVVTAADAEKTIYEADLSGPLSMVFGNEAHGVSSQLKKTGHLSLRIPIFGNAESLNVATAAAICLYEGVRQRAGHREARGT